MATTTDTAPAERDHSILHWAFAVGPLAAGGHVALRDVGFLLGALALARLSELYDTREVHEIDPTLSEEEQEIERRYA